jgi:multidrug efflux pump
LTDLTTAIEASVADVEFELVVTIGLVVMVILLFLRNLYATIIPSVAVPLSLIGTFAAMYALGYSLDNLSVMALTIATGFVVDDAIVMIENISRYIEQGLSPMQAAFKGAEHRVHYSIAYNFADRGAHSAAVYGRRGGPALSRIRGDFGRDHRHFGFCFAYAHPDDVFADFGAESRRAITVLPGLRAFLREHRRFLRPHSQIRSPIPDGYSVGSCRNTRFHDLSLHHHPKGFLPVQDTGVIQGISQAPDTISFPAMEEKQQQLASVILEDAAVESLSSFIGADGSNTTLSSGRMSINLKPLNVRKINASEVIRRLQQNLREVQGITLYMQPVQNITVDDRVSRTQYQYTLEDADANELDQWTSQFVAKLKELPQLADVATDQQTGGLAASLIIDRVTASRLGIAPSTIDNTLYDAFGQRQINTTFTQVNQYQ